MGGPAGRAARGPRRLPAFNGRATVLLLGSLAAASAAGAAAGPINAAMGRGAAGRDASRFARPLLGSPVLPPFLPHPYTASPAMAAVPYSFGYSNASAITRQPVYSSSVWWTGLNEFPLTPSGPLVRTAYATFVDLAAASDPSTFACTFTRAGPTLAGMIPGNFGDGTSYQPSLSSMHTGVSAPIPYDPALWVADSDRGVLHFATPPGQLGYAPPFVLTYYQYTQQGYVTVPKDLQVNGNAHVLGSLTVDGVSKFTGGEVYEDNLTVCGTLTVSGVSRFASAVSMSGPLTVAGASRLADLAVSGPLTVSGASMFAGAVSMSGPLTIAGTVSCSSVFSGAISASGSLTVAGSVSVSGASVFSGAVSVSGGLSLSGPIALAGTGVGVSGYVLTSQGGTTPAWTAENVNYIPVRPSEITTLTIVDVKALLEFITTNDRDSAFAVKESQTLRYPLVADRYGLRLSVVNGDASRFNDLFTAPNVFMPSYFIYDAAVPDGVPLYLPDNPTLYKGIQITIKSQSQYQVDIVSQKMIVVKEIAPGVNNSIPLEIGFVVNIFSAGNYWNVTNFPPIVV